MQRPVHGKPLVVELRSEANAEAVRDGERIRFGGIAYSGGPVRQLFAGETAVDLAAIRIKDSIPVTLNHDDNKIVGRARIVNDGKSLRIVDGEFSEVTPYGKEVAGLMAEGHPWEFSIGAGGRYVQADQKRVTKLNGRAMNLDSYLSDARLLHVSFVPAGADPNAIAARLSALFQQPEAPEMPDPNDDGGDVARLNARIQQLESDNATLAGQLAEARGTIAAAAKARRNERIAALFGDAEVPAAERAAYEAMTDEQFAAVEATLARVQRGADGALFAQVATHGRNEQGGAPAVTVKAPDGLPVDSDRLALHAKALAYQAAHPGTDYVTAALAVERS